MSLAISVNVFKIYTDKKMPDSSKEEQLSGQIIEGGHLPWLCKDS